MNTELRQPIQMLGALRPVNVWNPRRRWGARPRFMRRPCCFLSGSRVGVSMRRRPTRDVKGRRHGAKSRGFGRPIPPGIRRPLTIMV
jgi:hypothetical protein